MVQRSPPSAPVTRRHFYAPSRQRRQTGCDGLLWLSPNEAVNQAAVLEQEHGGNALDAELLRGARVLVDVELGDDVLALGLARELIHDGANEATGAAPGGPAIDEDAFA